jgi:hypothetical protein
MEDSAALLSPSSLIHPACNLPIVSTQSINLSTAHLLSLLDSVRASAALLNQRVSAGEVPPMGGLVLNAAVQHLEGRIVAVDELESHFAVNYLANFLFVLMVLGSIDQEWDKIIMIFTPLHDSYYWMNTRIFPEGHKEMFTDTETIACDGDNGETDGEKPI